MNAEKLFHEIDLLAEEYLRVWEDVCNIESPSHHKAGVDAVGKYFSDMASTRGWTVETLPQTVSGDVVCITMNPTAEGEPVCISGHMDTVHPLGSFGTPAVRIDGDRICGPGVADCKGGVVAGFMAMDALHRLGFSSRPVRLLLQSDEEVSSMPSNKETINYISQKAQGATAFLNLENYKGKERKLRNAARDSSRMSVPVLRDCLEILADADTHMKTNYGGDNWQVLEHTVTRLIKRAQEG